jgi:hypothetical protein
MSEITVSEALEGAADYMEKYGKTERQYRDVKTGSVCAIGALRAYLAEQFSMRFELVSEYHPVTVMAMVALGDYLKVNPYLPELQPNTCEVITWSDTSTQETVVQTLRDVAIKERDDAM